jgi:pre-mRNA-processing factor 6
VFTTLGRMFWRDRKLGQAEVWFERSLELNKKYGDCWAYYYKFQKENNEEKSKKILERCIKANPNQGEIWISIAKDPKNAFSLTTEEILKLVSSKIGNEI